MLILILINAQCLQNVVFSFEKGLSGQNPSLSDEKLSDRKIPPWQISHASVLQILQSFFEKCYILSKFL